MKSVEKVAILGGAFDPPHLGHKAVIQHVLDSGLVDRVVVMPCGKHKLKRHIATCSRQRLEMSKLAFENMPQVRVSDFDIQISEGAFRGDAVARGSTWMLFSEFQKRLVNHGSQVQLYCIIGQDNADTIRFWYNWKRLLAEIGFIVLPRCHQTQRHSWYLQPPHFFLEHFPQINISSTELRAGYKQEYLDRQVVQYIKNNKLYQPSNITQGR